MLIDRLLDTGAARVTEFRTADGALHDRSQTVGGSENHTCIRRLWFAKRGTAPDPGYRDNWGFFQRGHTVEDWLVGLITDALPEGYRLLYTGKDQRTLVSGRLSATPDGLLIASDGGLSAGGGEELVIEIKSLDPRSNLDTPKHQHIHQVQIQMGLFRETTKHQPERALLLYVNASDYSHIVEHQVEFDPGRYAEAKSRADRVFDTPRAADLPAEGAWDDSCRYCPFTEACGVAVVEAAPRQSYAQGTSTDLEPEDLDTLKSLVLERDGVVCEIEELTRDKKILEERIKLELRRHDLKKIEGEGWSISHSLVAGRRSLDTDALETALDEAGLDLDDFYKTGRESERLTIKVNR